MKGIVKMKEFIRHIDDLGRVVIPMEMRRGFGIKDDDPLNIQAVPAGILLSPLNASCVICGSTEDLLQIEGIGVCRRCAERLSQKLKETKAK